MLVLWLGEWHFRQLQRHAQQCTAAQMHQPGVCFSTLPLDARVRTENHLSWGKAVLPTELAFKSSQVACVTTY